jgi:type II secretory pathway component PulC
MTAGHRLLIVCALALAHAGCARSQSATDSAPAATASPAPEEPRAAPPASPTPGVPAVARSTLLATLDRGPGEFLHELLQDIDVEAHFEGGAFAGWQLVAVDGRSDRLEGLDLRAGDVITEINGYGIERPEYLSAIFVELRTAEAIVVGGERAGEPFEIRVPITDD